MPILIAALGFMLSSTLLRIIMALGVGIFTYNVVEGYIYDALSYFAAAIHSVASEGMDILLLMGLAEGLSVLISTMLTIMTIKSAKVFVGVR